MNNEERARAHVQTDTYVDLSVVPTVIGIIFDKTDGQLLKMGEGEERENMTLLLKVLYLICLKFS